MKRLIAVIVALILMISGCSSAKENFQDSFNSYMENRYDSQFITFPSGYEIKPFAWVNKESKSYNPDVLLNTYAFRDDYFVQDLDIIRTDMRFLADIFFDFAESIGMSNDYHLYVEFSDEFDILYDYENDTFYTAESYEEYLALYENFRTIDPDSVLLMPNGQEYLVDHGFGIIKHKKFEMEHLFGVGAYIDNEGVFQRSSYGITAHYMGDS